MCIAIIKNAGASLPSKETLQRCWTANPDGAGFCYPIAGNKIQIYKGFNAFEEFWAAISTQDYTETSMLIHFRIGTHGGKTNPHMTHPFPVTDNIEDLNALSIKTKRAIIHNGIISSFTYNKEISDTAAFASDAMTILSMNDPKQKRIIEALAGTSKVAEMLGDGTVLHTSSGWIAHEGCLYSNETFRERKTTYTSIYSGDCTFGKKWKKKGERASRSLPKLPFNISKGETEIPLGKTSRRSTLTGKQVEMSLKQELEMHFMLKSPWSPNQGEFWCDFLLEDSIDSFIEGGKDLDISKYDLKLLHEMASKTLLKEGYRVGYQAASEDAIRMRMPFYDHGRKTPYSEYETVMAWAFIACGATYSTINDFIEDGSYGSADEALYFDVKDGKIVISNPAVLALMSDPAANTLVAEVTSDA